MRLKGTVQDLSEHELSHAPPFSSAKDPVNMAGYVAQNILDGRTDVWLSDELDDLEIPDTQLVDVRTEDEHSVGAIPGSINIHPFFQTKTFAWTLEGGKLSGSLSSMV